MEADSLRTRGTVKGGSGDRKVLVQPSKECQGEQGNERKEKEGGGRKKQGVRMKDQQSRQGLECWVRLGAFEPCAVANLGGQRAF